MKPVLSMILSSAVCAAALFGPQPSSGRIRNDAVCGREVGAPDDSPAEYRVGQDLGFGYVLYVDATGRHGLVVSKTCWRSSPGKVYELGFGPDAAGRRWRLPSVAELRYVYDNLKARYPAGTYLARTERDLNFEAVTFHRRKLYTGRVYDAYTYRVLMVAPF